MKVSFVLFVAFISFFANNATSIELKVDTHSHVRIEWDQPITINASIEWHKLHGFDAVAFTEHSPWLNDPRPFDDLWLPLERIEIDPDMPVIPGIEWTLRSLHVAVLFRPSTYEAARVQIRDNVTVHDIMYDYGICRDLTLYCQMADVTHDLGGILGVAHYSLTVLNNFQKGSDGCHVDSLEDIYSQCHFDFVEVGNTIMDPIAYYFAKDNNYPMVAGTDVHDFDDEWDRQAPVAYTIVNATSKTPEAIFDAIQKGNVYVDYNFESISNSTRNILVIIFITIGAGFAAAGGWCVKKCRQ